ncbi:MAG: lysyl-tRNA synthetase class 2 [Enterobacterales bacterium]|jgi:lysyl-tRNA synthetase class 2
MNENPSNNDWQPTASHSVLVERAKLLAKIRQFFSSKNVLEVDTPSLSHGTITDVYLDALESSYQNNHGAKQPLYLQTSPEFAMKRLLAAGSGSIYQICRAYRDDQIGRYHNPEFLMLEWYRVDFDHLQLMAEMDELLTAILATEPADIITYQQLFMDTLQLDPLIETKSCLQKIVTEKTNGPILDERDELLQCLFVILIEPFLGQEKPLMVVDFPASQSSLARLSKTDPRVAERFEVYYKGVELANGFHELQDTTEQRERFNQDNGQRKRLGKEQKPLDERFLAALESGLPDCAGVALGLDRLLMLKLNKKSIQEVMPFTLDRA